MSLFDLVFLEARSYREPFMLGAKLGDPGPVKPHAGVTAKIKKRTSREERRRAKESLAKGKEPKQTPLTVSRGSGGTKSSRTSQWQDWGDSWRGKGPVSDLKARRK